MAYKGPRIPGYGQYGCIMPNVTDPIGQAIPYSETFATPYLIPYHRHMPILVFLAINMVVGQGMYYNFYCPGNPSNPPRSKKENELYSPLLNDEPHMHKSEDDDDDE